MSKRIGIGVRFFILCVFVACTQPHARAQESDLQITGPFSTQNLSVFLIHSTHPQIQHDYLTLDEAIKQGKAKLRETGTTNLSIVNNSKEDIFIQSGEIVKGGQQDRMIANDLVIPPGENQIPIAAFCVEHDRSTQRGSEPLAEFSGASEIAPLPSMQLAVKRQLLRPTSTVSSSASGDGYTAPVQSATNAPQDDPESMSAQLGWYLGQIPYQETAEQKAWQQEVWDGVAKVQKNLSLREGVSVKSSVSPSSLELTLEESKVRIAVDSIVRALRDSLVLDPTTVGIVCTVRGNIVGADIYGSSNLFQQHLLEILRAAAVHALTEQSSTLTPPKRDVVRQFLMDSPQSAPFERDVTNRVHLKSWDERNRFLFESTDQLFPVNFLHKSYLAK